MISSTAFYAEYHGHPVSDLDDLARCTDAAAIHALSKEVAARAEEGEVKESRPITRIFLVGDSSLDNKHWFFPPMYVKKRYLATHAHFREDDLAACRDEPSLEARLSREQSLHDFVAPAVNGYEAFLDPPVMVKDISYWLNCECLLRGLGGTALSINCAIEESSVGERYRGLLPQDELVAKHITNDDVLVVSVGGNDIALKPSVGTLFAMAAITYLTPSAIVHKYKTALGLGHMRNLFKKRIEDYVKRILSERSVKPKAVAVCMIYYPCEEGSGWASFVLNRIGYRSNPAKLQALIRILFEEATMQINLGEGIKVVPVPLFEALDPKDPADYEQQVEPSVSGGQKMAKLIMDRLHETLQGGNA